MKKINEKGFALAETIVVGIFIMGLLTFLILNVLPLVGDYERVDKYDDLDKKYDVHLIRKMILMEEDSTSINEILSLGSDGYTKYDVSSFCAKFKNSNYCNALLSKEYLNVKTVIITSYNTTNVKNNAKKFERGLEEYIGYLPTYDYMTSTYIRYGKYKRVIIEFSDGTFSNIEVKYEES